MHPLATRWAHAQKVHPVPGVRRSDLDPEVNPAPGLGGHGHVVVTAACGDGHCPAGTQLTDRGGVSSWWNTSDTDGEETATTSRRRMNGR